MGSILVLGGGSMKVISEIERLWILFLKKKI